MFNEKDGVWRTIGGRRVFIRTGQSMKNAMKESGKFNFKNRKLKENQAQKNAIKNQVENASKLSEAEYDKLCKDFAEKLSPNEKEIIRSYGVGGGTSYSLNEPQYRKAEFTYRFIDEKSPTGFVEKKLSLKEALDTKLDKRALSIKTKDKDWDENIKFNHERLEREQQFVRKMDRIFENKAITLDKDIVVFRKGHEKLDDFKENGSVERYGYTSTSSRTRINANTPGGLKLGENEYEIIIPKGTKFLPIKSLVPDDVKKQNEILLSRNSRFELISDKSTSGDWVFKETKRGRNMVWKKGENRYVVRVKQAPIGLKNAYEAYLKEHPNSKMTLKEFETNIYK